MAKREKAVNGETRFFDKTNYQWFNQAGTSEVTFCQSTKDLIEGKGETFTFTGKHLSLKTVTKDDKEKEHNRFFLFVLADGSFILANKWSEMR